MNWMYGDQTGVESTNTTNPVTRPEPTGGEVEALAKVIDSYGDHGLLVIDNRIATTAEMIARAVLASDWLAAYVQAARDEERARAWEDGVRQALAWLQADYPYGSGPDWRENGVDWIADRLAEHLARGGAR